MRNKKDFKFLYLLHLLTFIRGFAPVPVKILANIVKKPITTGKKPMKSGNIIIETGLKTG